MKIPREEEVAEIIRNLKNERTPGEDQIATKMLKGGGKHDIK